MRTHQPKIEYCKVRAQMKDVAPFGNPDFAWVITSVEGLLDAKKWTGRKFKCAVDLFNDLGGFGWAVDNRWYDRSPEVEFAEFEFVREAI